MGLALHHRKAFASLRMSIHISAKVKGAITQQKALAVLIPRWGYSVFRSSTDFLFICIGPQLIQTRLHILYPKLSS